MTDSNQRVVLGGEGFEDVLGSGGIFRKYLKQTDKARPEFGQEVTVRYSIFLLDDPQQRCVAHEVERTFRIGDAEVMPALELVAKMLRVQEQVEVHCEPRFGFGDKQVTLDHGNSTIPAMARLRMVLELVRIDDCRNIAELDSKELLHEAEKKKISGNRFFKEQNYEQAAKLYKRALKILESWEPNEEEKLECRNLFVDIANNVANVQLKMDQLKEAKQSCLDVLQIDEHNVKALYRLGRICLLQSDFDQGLVVLRKALAKEPNNTSVRDLISRIHEAKQRAKAKEKQIFGNLWRNSSSAASQQQSTNPDGTQTGATGASTLTKRSLVSSLLQTLGFSLVTVLVAWLVYHFQQTRQQE